MLCLDHHQLLANITFSKCRNKFQPKSSRVCVGSSSWPFLADRDSTELQAQYSNYKETLQAIAQKIGDVETEAEEHKYVFSIRFLLASLYSKNWCDFVAFQFGQHY